MKSVLFVFFRCTECSNTVIREDQARMIQCEVPLKEEMLILSASRLSSQLSLLSSLLMKFLAESCRIPYESSNKQPVCEQGWEDALRVHVPQWFVWPSEESFQVVRVCEWVWGPRKSVFIWILQLDTGVNSQLHDTKHIKCGLILRGWKGDRAWWDHLWEHLVYLLVCSPYW